MRSLNGEWLVSFRHQKRCRKLGWSQPFPEADTVAVPPNWQTHQTRCAHLYTSNDLSITVNPLFVPAPGRIRRVVTSPNI
ncbi:sugar-binding domain-containing protein [Escherichia coli]|uniref:sugar-binding domain-containing protein n=1 Tax=Escherichia coli TaxID=562 RepID=UPI00388E5184